MRRAWNGQSNSCFFFKWHFMVLEIASKSREILGDSPILGDFGHAKFILPFSVGISGGSSDLARFLGAATKPVPGGPSIATSTLGEE